MWDDVIELISETHTDDDAGDSIPNGNNRQLFCNKKSIGQAEFYQAHSEGFKPEIKIQLNKLDYQGERKAIYDGKEYKIIRTYEDNDFIEITLEGDVHVGS
ncbi:phage head closure protein [Cellulosilyticum sp. ST5]|uniref:phage head closure protein n=1 Tax=Cellulosilyticum sp. ST5 TaxID=3055805 RepID=UPI003977A763